MRVDDQLDLFHYNPTQDDLNRLAGEWDEKNPYVNYITAPRWNNTHGMWTCLANVGGLLCTVEVFITVPDVA